MMADVSRRHFAKLVAGTLLLPVLAPMLSRNALAANNMTKIALLLPVLSRMAAGVHWRLPDCRT